MDYITKSILTFTLGVLLTPMVSADDNEVTILQEGDNFELDITQIGYSNIIKQWTASEGIDGEDNTIIIKQINHSSFNKFLKKSLSDIGAW